MILVKPSFEILEIMGIYGDWGVGRDAVKLIEKAGRTCYKSEDKITLDSCEPFVGMIKKRGHHSILEHSAMMVKFICDRGVTHELVRHRLCAFSQESTRYCNYKGGVTFVIPPWVDVKPGNYNAANDVGDTQADYNWANAMILAEDVYKRLLKTKWSPQQARSVLPNSTKTEIVVTANFREWLHIFKLRCSSAAHPQMQELMKPLQKEMIKRIPSVFGDS